MRVVDDQGGNLIIHSFDGAAPQGRAADRQRRLARLPVPMVAHNGAVECQARHSLTNTDQQGKDD